MIGQIYAGNRLTHFYGKVHHPINGNKNLLEFGLKKNRETTLETAHPFTGKGNAGHRIASKNLGNCLQCVSYQRKQKCCIPAESCLKKFVKSHQVN